MRASERAPGAAGAGVRARAAVWCVLTSVVSIAASHPGAARADAPGSDARTLEPAATEARDGPFVLRLAIENDNLLFGNYARMVGREHDGTDLGRTHASSVGLRYDVGDRVDLRLDLSSELFTASLGGALPMPHTMVPVAFHELDRLRVGVALRQPGAPWRVRLGLAVEASNHEQVTFGASGQQRAWHDFMANTVQSGSWEYDHRPSGLGVRFGGATDASAGGATSIAIAPWLSLRASGAAGARLATILAGSALTSRGRFGVSIGEPRGVRLVLAVEQHAYVWIESVGVMLRSTIDARLDFHHAALQVALHRHDGDQNAAYFFYVAPNTTMTVALTGRL